MKVAKILLSGALLFSSHVVLAQSASGTMQTKPGRAETVKSPHASGGAASRSNNDSDRAIDAEMRRIDRMMTICNNC